MKVEYLCKMVFFHGLQPWACEFILQKNEVPNSYQEMMKGAKCMEDDFMFHKSAGGQSNHPKVGNSQAKRGSFKGDKKRKWKKVPNKSQEP